MSWEVEAAHLVNIDAFINKGDNKMDFNKGVTDLIDREASRRAVADLKVWFKDYHWSIDFSGELVLTPAGSIHVYPSKPASYLKRRFSSLKDSYVILLLNNLEDKIKNYLRNVELPKE